MPGSVCQSREKMDDIHPCSWTTGKLWVKTRSFSFSHPRMGKNYIRGEMETVSNLAFKSLSISSAAATAFQPRGAILEKG